MSYLNQANELLGDLLQYAQHVETIAGSPSTEDFHALQRCTELCADLVDAIGAYQSEASNQKRQLAEVYPVTFDEYIAAALER